MCPFHKLAHARLLPNYRKRYPTKLWHRAAAKLNLPKYRSDSSLRFEDGVTAMKVAKKRGYRVSVLGTREKQACIPNDWKVLADMVARRLKLLRNELHQKVSGKIGLSVSAARFVE